MLTDACIIKTPICDIDYGKFRRDIYERVTHIVTPVEDICIESFVNKDAILLEHKKVYDDDFYGTYIKENFNCLKEKGDLLFFSKEEFLCGVSYKYVRLFSMFGDLDDLISGIGNQSTKEKFVKLFLYDITKDLKYLDELIKTGMMIPLCIFELYKKASRIEQYIEIAEILDGTKDSTNYDPSGDFSSYKELMNKLHDEKIEEAKIKLMKKGASKNLIIIHLESMSNEIYFNHRDKLVNLTELFDMSVNLTRFYTSASSSVMSLFDLFYGNDFETDNYVCFDELYHDKTYTKHLFQILKDNGYNTLGIGFNEVPSVEETNRSNVFNVEGQKYRWVEDFNDFLDCTCGFIIDNKNRNSPFALHVWDLLTHSGHFDNETMLAHSYAQKTELSVISIDIMIKRIIDTLKDNGLLSDTVIVCYGDHGDELWTREMNNGFTHVTPPRLNLIWSPCSIYDSRITPFLFNNLASTIDLKSTILFALGIEYDEDFKYQGINLFLEKNEYIYSRSLFYNQREYQNLGSYQMIALNNFKNTEINNKAMAVITERYDMVAGKDGLELYNYASDPWNYNNLLNFIEFDSMFVPRKLLNYGAWRGHFRKIMLRDSQVYELLYYFRILTKKLTERVEIKNGLITSKERNEFSPENFKKVRGRGFVHNNG